MSKKPLVLIAEDNELNLKLFSDLLEVKGLDYIGVSDGNKVLEVAKKRLPDLILMDKVKQSQNLAKRRATMCQTQHNLL